MSRSPVRFVFLCAICFCLATEAEADWIAGSGYAQLSSELGAAMPTGSGIIVLQTEANTGSSSNVLYMPQASDVSPFAGAGNYSGKTFTVDTTLGGYSSHADQVATHYYGNSGSVAPGVTNVHVMLADTFLDDILGDSGPQTFAGSVQNHSWIATTTGSPADDDFVLRAFDYMINRDGVVACVPMNNGTGALPAFMANSYNAVSVGLLSGQHSLGGSTADGSGRMKPDLVVNEVYTSFASPAVASSAAMLRQAVKAGFTSADNPQTIKAMLIAGASKTNLPSWHRIASTAPYDSTFGAGELNVRNAYHILANGSQAAGADTAVSSSGWNNGTALISSPAMYFFTIPAGSMANVFSAALTWHRNVTLSDGNYGSTLPDLVLTLYPANNFTVSGTPIDQSNSPLDNVQHVFEYNLPAGQYALQISSDTDNVSYGLAWQAQLGCGATLAVVANASSGVFLNLANLDPYVTYTIQQSGDLVNWTSATTILTSATTASTTSTWQDVSANINVPKFYRLQWTAVR